MTQKRGKYILFEGPDKCGKTTQSAFLHGYFNQTGIKHLPVREPGDTFIGRNIRGIVLNKEIDLKSSVA